MQLTLMRVNELGLKVRRAGLQHDLRAVQQKSHFCLDTLPGEEAEALVVMVGIEGRAG